ncbi:MAG: SURF1 family protein [Nevskiaceae bacterium]|nr:MAG: SURF1 family protein [Nevskiaceae bacterium]
MPQAAAPLRLALALAALLLVFAGFVALGNWQVQRRAWKLDLIERVDRRVHAPAAAAPPRARWAAIGRDDEYTHVCADGRFLHLHETLVQAVTERGPGNWVLTPLRTAGGEILIVNRGFVPPEQRLPASRAAGQVAGTVHVCGLLRFSEPGGGFLRHNDPVAGRWYSRDVAAIAAARGLPVADVAPYFIDADATPNPGGWPLGGLTVVQFRNSHLSYALTWYGLALMTLVAMGVLLRHEWRRRG